MCNKSKQLFRLFYHHLRYSQQLPFKIYDLILFKDDRICPKSAFSDATLEHRQMEVCSSMILTIEAAYSES
jgi:hypothetical protein